MRERRWAEPSDVASGAIKLIDGKHYKAVFMPVPDREDYITRAVWHRATGKEIRRHERLAMTEGAWADICEPMNKIISAALDKP